MTLFSPVLDIECSELSFPLAENDSNGVYVVNKACNKDHIPCLLFVYDVGCYVAAGYKKLSDHLISIKGSIV